MRRIVSLVPSITETLCDFGLQSEIVGCTSFCVHPPNLRHTAKKVGGTKDARLEDIINLAPTHIVVNTEENLSELISQLKTWSTKHNARLIETFPVTVDDSISMVQDLGKIFEVDAFLSQWNREVDLALKACKAISKPIRYAYFIWREPWMVAGNQTYISHMLSKIGFMNVFETDKDPKARYPAVQLPSNSLARADVLLFSSEPYAFKTRHMDEFRTLSGLEVEFRKIDGQALSWYGTRTLAGLQYLKGFVDEVDSQ